MSKKTIFFLLLFSLGLLVILFFDQQSKAVQLRLDFLFWNFRLPRVLLGFLAGAILALSGLLSQHIFRNSLATPDILGFSAGAAALIAFAVHCFPFQGAGVMRIVAGFSGSLLAMGLLLTVLKIVNNFSIYVILMAGVALSFFFSALVVLIQYLLDYAQTYVLLRWLMGGLQTSGYGDVLLLGLLFCLVLLFLFFWRYEIILLATPESFADSRGVDSGKVRRIALMLLAVIVGGIVSVTGPIGFIALIVPHLSLLLCRGNYLQRILITPLLGGGLLLIADFLARSLIYPVEIPVGVITSFLGAPYFLILLLKTFRTR